MFADMKSMVMKAWHEHYALRGDQLYESGKCAAIRVAEKIALRSFSISIRGIWRIFQHPSRHGGEFKTLAICLSTGRSGA